MSMSSTGMVFRIRNDVPEDKQGQTDVQQAENAGENQVKTPSLGTTQDGEVTQEHQEVNQKETDSGVKEIFLTGPLGHAYTEAIKHLLNKRNNKTGVIRTESNMTQMLVTDITAEEEADPIQQAGADMDKAFVFVYDGRRMNLGEVEAMVHRVLTAKSKNPDVGYVGVVIEGMDEVLAKKDTTASVFSQEVLHMESVKGINVIFSRTTAMGRIETLLGV